MKLRKHILFLAIIFISFLPLNGFTDLNKLRDPFRRPTISPLKFQDSQITSNTQKEELNEAESLGGFVGLEFYSSDQIKLIGVLVGPEKNRALVQTPDGQSFILSEKSRIGNRQGIVKKIAADRIILREKTVNQEGRDSWLETTLPLYVRPKVAAKNLENENRLDQDLEQKGASSI